MLENYFDFASRDHKPPYEVWKAAIGCPDDLVALLMSDNDLGEWTRLALASLLAGELKVSKRMGRRRVFGLPQLLRRNPGKLLLDLAAQEYRDEMKAARLADKGYGCAEQMIQQISEKYELHPDALRNTISQRNRRLFAKAPQYHSNPQTQVDHFQRWLDLYGYDLMDEMRAKSIK